MFPLIALLLLTTAPATPPVPAESHNFHVSYGRLAVQGRSAMLQVRFFRDDLEETLQAATGRQRYRMDATPDVERHFLDYFNRHLVVTLGGKAVPGRIVGSGEENDMWWYRIQYTAPADFRTFSIRNTLLFDTFDDQRNIFKVMHFPGEQVETLYFTAGAEVFTVRF